MKKIIINNFAAISSLESSLDKNLTVVIGAQASGKSTVSKLIYFCRRVKDYMLEFLVEPKNFTTIHPNEHNLLQRTSIRTANSTTIVP